jgi:hypothetical protein
MAQSKNIPKPPKFPTTKRIKTTQNLTPQIDLDQKSPEEKPSQEQVAKHSSPEIKPTTAELDMNKDQNLDMSDLKKP